MRTRNLPAPRGFTLIEMVVAMSVGLVVVAAAAEVMVSVDRARRITVTKVALERDAELVLDWMRRDLASVGTALVGGMRADSVSGDTRLQPPIMAFVNSGSSLGSRTTGTLAPDAFTVLADLPRPDSNFDGLSNFSDRATTATEMYPVNELSGASDTAAGGFHRGALDPSSNCGNADAPGCPWGLRKYRLDGASSLAQVQVFYSTGRYANATLSSFSVGPSKITLTAPLALPDEVNRPIPQARLAQLDRVAYRVTAGQLQRRQCWSALNLENAGAALLSDNCGNDDDAAMGWQVMARNVQGETGFTYLDRNGAATTTPSQVRAVMLTLVLRKDVALSGGRVRPVYVRLRDTFALGYR